MDILTYQAHFETEVQSKTPALDVKSAWNDFKQSFFEPLDGERCEEFGFSAGTASQKANQFQIYFGRVIDAQPGSSWRTAEINVYFRFEIDPVLQRLLDELGYCAFEDALCLTEGPDAVRQKQNAFIASVDGKPDLWVALRGRTPALREFQFIIV